MRATRHVRGVSDPMTTVRPARPSELVEVGDLTVAAYVDDGLLRADDVYVECLRDARSRAREAELYVARLDDQPDAIAGTVTFCPRGSAWSEIAGPEEGEFRMLAVAAAARRRGVAEALVRVCLDRSTELGYTAVVLSSLPVQRPAHRVYRRLGFRRVPDRDWSPAEGVTLLSFRIDL